MSSMEKCGRLFDSVECEQSFRLGSNARLIYWVVQQISHKKPVYFLREAQAQSHLFVMAIRPRNDLRSYFFLSSY